MGNPHTEESRAKLREAWKRRRLTPVSAETRLKQSLVRKGKPKSAEWRRKIGLTKIGKTHFQPPCSEAHKQAISCANVGRVRVDMQGDKNPKWKDGRSKDINHLRLLRRLHKHKRRGLGEIHSELWENLKSRYSFTCPACARSEPQLTLTIDHIIPISKGGTNDLSNLQPLCRSCNSRKMTMVKKYPLVNAALVT